MMRRFSVCSFIVACCARVAAAQSSSHQYITVVAEPDHADWTYHVGEEAHITAYAIKENARMAGTTISYSYGPDKLDAVYNGTVTTDASGVAHFTVPAAKAPGFTSSVCFSWVFSRPLSVGLTVY